MQTVLIICALLLTAAFIVLVVYAALALHQAQRTMKSVETLSEKMNREVEKVETVTSAAASVANAFSGTMGKSVALAFSLARAFLKKRNGQSSEAAERQAAENE
jgi:uncharacterized protein YoxC